MTAKFGHAFLDIRRHSVSVDNYFGRVFPCNLRNVYKIRRYVCRPMYVLLLGWTVSAVQATWKNVSEWSP